MNVPASFSRASRMALVASALAAGASLAGCSGSAEDAAVEEGFGSSTEAWTEVSTGTFDAGRLALLNTFARPFDMRIRYGERGGCVLMSRQTFALVYPGYEYRTSGCYWAADRQAIRSTFASPLSPFEMPDRYIVNPDPVPNFTLGVTDLGLNALTSSMESDGLHLRGSLRVRFHATSWLVNPWAELSNVAVDARIVTANGYLSADQVTVNLGSWYAECGAGNWCVGYVSDAISAQRSSLETTIRTMLNGFLYKPETYQFVYGALERIENTVNRPAGAAPWIVGLGSLRFEGGAFRYDMRRVGASSTPNCEVRVGCGTTATVQCTANADRISLAEGTRAIATNATSGEGATTRFIDRNLRIDGKTHRYVVCAMSDDNHGTEVNRSCTSVAFTAVEAANCKGASTAAPPAK